MRDQDRVIGLPGERSFALEEASDRADRQNRDRQGRRDPEANAPPLPSGRAAPAHEQEQQESDVKLREVLRQQRGHPIEALRPPNDRPGQRDSAGIQRASEGDWHRANGMMWPAKLSSSRAATGLALSWLDGGERRGRSAGMEIRTVGVVGCGLMGAGIAEVCAHAGYDTVVREVDPATLARGIERIQSSMATAVTRKRLSEDDRDAAMGRLRGVTELGDLGPCDLVIEAVTENPQAKKDVFRVLEASCGPETIFASNTSSIPIIELASVTKRPEKVLGMHFMNPVPVMRLIELVRSIQTSDETLAVARAFGDALGKRVIVSKDRAGFIVNMLLIPYLLEAIRMYEGGFAAREDIDLGMMLGTNHPMGPLTLLDYVGLDTTYFIANILWDEFHEPKYAPPPLLKQMVTAGMLGRKSGRGFYDCDRGEQPPRA